MKNPENMKKRLVRRIDMVPCKSAFIDSHTPGSHLKDNFSIIGPGVTENKEQYINIRESHGFNIGAAGQPPYIKNSLHSHFTAEVFIIHEGTFKIFWGLYSKNSTILSEGDIISIPINCFRGFENVGNKYGFMFTILGGDNTGGVEWAPQVFKEAKDNGLVLLNDFGVWDTNKKPIPQGATLVRPMSYKKAETFDNYSNEEMELRIFRSDALETLGNNNRKIREYISFQMDKIIGTKDAYIQGREGFELFLFRAKPGVKYEIKRKDKEVLICTKGKWNIVWAGGGKRGFVLMNSGDLLSIPKNYERLIECIGNVDSSMYSVTRVNEN